MREFVGIANASGKTVEVVNISGPICVITFADQTWTAIKATPGYDNDVEIHRLADFEIAREEFPVEWLINTGVLTREEADAISQRQEKQNAERQERWDRDTYERLRRKFEGG